jgi:hypothetical protein
MAITSANDVITASLRKIGVLAIEAGEVATAAAATAGLDDLNMMLKSWATRRLVLRAPTLLGGFALTAAKYSYSVKVSGDLNTACPLSVLSAYYRDASGYDYPLDLLTREQYDGYFDKAVTTGAPQALFFDPGATQQAARAGTIYIYPVPDSAATYTLYIEALVSLTSFATLTTAYTLPDEYLEAIVYNLAVRLAPDYGRPTPAEVAAIAKASFDNICRLNAPQLVRSVDMPGCGGSGGGNIYTMGGG